MRTMLRIVDIVCKCHEARREVVRVLERNLHGNIPFCLVYIENILVHHCLMLVVETDERAQTSLKEEGHGWHLEPNIAQVECLLCFHTGACVLARINNGDASTLHEIRLLAQVRDNLVPIPFDAAGEDGFVRAEHHNGAGLRGLSHLLHFRDRLTNFVFLRMDGAFLMDEYACVR